jgi:hypothetical protein
MMTAQWIAAVLETLNILLNICLYICPSGATLCPVGAKRGPLQIAD